MTSDSTARERLLNGEAATSTRERGAASTWRREHTQGAASGKTSARGQHAGGPQSNGDLALSLGPKMRQARKQQHLTLQQVAARADLSVSYLSQIERNLLTPSVGTLKRIATALGVATGQLIAPDALGPRAMVAVLRKRDRKRVAFPQSSISYELLMPDFRRRASALWLTAEPGADSGPAQSHEGEDIVIVLQGQLEVDVAGALYSLGAGDTICFNSELPHRWSNRGTRLAKAIWISSPPYL